jgi:hypothetical protein
MNGDGKRKGTVAVAAAFLSIMLALVSGGCSETPEEGAAPPAAEAARPAWALNATIIEACSCPMFCSCYFNTQPAGHAADGHAGMEHFCRFNNAYRVNSGWSGDVSLDGAKFWAAGDLGGDYSEGKMDWIVVTFDPSVTPPQREAIQQALGHVYPVEWGSFKVAEDAPIEWTATGDRAEARLGGGKISEVILQRTPGMSAGPVVIQNLKYWGVPRHDGFILMPNEVEAYRAGDKPFEYKGTNGFMITFDINADDVASTQQARLSAH